MSVIFFPQFWGQKWLRQFYGHLAFVALSARKSPFPEKFLVWGRGGTICPETITELIRFEFLRCKNYVTAPEINSPRGPKSPEITVWKSFKSPVRIEAPKNNSKTISVM